MQRLNLPEYKLKVISEQGRTQIFDSVRRKYFVLTPEEWVRQNFIAFLNEEKGYPLSLMAVEKGIKVNNLAKRCDIVIYNTAGDPNIIVECKAPKVSISQETFDQAARYNMRLKVNYLVVTNGMQHFCCYIDHIKGTFAYLSEIPDFA